MAKEARFVVRVERAEKPLKVEKEVSEALKALAGRRLLDRREYVKCPVKGEDVAFLRCFVCASFIRRIKGFVHCSGERFEIRS
ncbi:MAG: hypothetical protein LZ166_01050 [Thaumarchaeota archaeon]|jgi:hypothetical protein|nr:hypothetical protein [Nitrososphaerota archaeon]MCL7386102.1 hypothetical protein [Candidatus Wolframiiraptor allenii]MCL7393814.1 hypothetical protein [Candidatus Wolframiiraptor allenii]